MRQTGLAAAVVALAAAVQIAAAEVVRAAAEAAVATDHAFVLVAVVADVAASVRAAAVPEHSVACVIGVALAEQEQSVHSAIELRAATERLVRGYCHLPWQGTVGRDPQKQLE